MQQAAYEDIYKKKECLNNIVGDYLGHYQYQTPINGTVMRAISDSTTAVRMVTALLRQSFEVAIGPSGGYKTDQFKSLLFTQSLMHAGLKLQLIIVDRVSAPQLAQFIKRTLTLELLDKMIQVSDQDVKLVKILRHLRAKIYPES